MIQPDPSLVLWLFKKAGRPIEAGTIRRSFRLRWGINSLDFFMTWGTLVMIAWLILDLNTSLRVGVACVAVGSLVYGFMVASLPSKITRTDDN